MKQKGSLVVISGFSGVGKGTVIKELMQLHEQYALSVSCTTRAPREGEVDGKDYFFITRDRFEEMIEQEAFFEYALYCDHYYGTPRPFVEKQLEEGRHVLLEIEDQGAMTMKAKCPEAILIFIMPPSGQELINRLCARGTETKEAIAQRVHKAVVEAESIENYEYVVVNDVPSLCAERIHGLVEALQMRTIVNGPFVKEVRGQVIQSAEDF